jgi:multidrug efflux pump subunit AcrA (membrane-fusion protein)
MKSAPRLTLYIGIAVVLILAGIGGWYVGLRNGNASAPSTAPERKVLYWHDPMVPGPKFDKPGKSPFMDMQLVPVFDDESAGAGGPPIVTVRPEIASSLGVRTAAVTRGRPARELSTHGYLVREGATLVVLADIFERDISWVRAGLEAQVRVPDAPGKAWPASVAAVERDVEIGARSVKARVRVRNPDSATPNQLVEVIIRAPAAPGNAVYVPREAVIRTGTRTAVVIALGEGRFQPVDVVAGAEAGDFIEIVKGLTENDRVVVSGQFLIDSEASARASFTRMETPK